jgi:hypothetical protein
MLRPSDRCPVMAMLLVGVSLRLVAGTTAAAQTAAPSPPPTPTPCETFPPPTLTVEFSADPAHPVVGNQVQLSFRVSGRGGLPAYTLSGAAPVFEGETSTITSNQLGTVTYHLTAVQAGTATLSLHVYYETWVGCVTQPIYEFVSDASPPFSVEVAEWVTPTPTPVPPATTCNPSANDCPDGHQCLCCCGTWVCMPPYLPCCALPCSTSSSPTPTPTLPATCEPIAGLTDCQADDDCVVVDQIDCCPCSSGGHQAAINRSKQDELGRHLEVCCAAAGICLQIYQCQDNLGATCQSGMCTLLNAVGTPTPTPTPPGECIGDCNGDSVVTIDELIRGVNIDLGSADLGTCPRFNCCGQLGSCNPDITCLVRAVGNALYGCRTPTPTPFAVQTCTGPSDCSLPLVCVAPPPGPLSIGVCLQPNLPSCAGIAGRRCPSDLVCLEFEECCDLLGVCVPPAAYDAVCASAAAPAFRCPAPPPTPVLYHGHTCCECAADQCTDFAWVEVEPTCPPACATVMHAECEAPCHGGPLGGPPVCVPLTPCTSDVDCDDGNGCSLDRCTRDGCTHTCVCD